MRTIERLLLMAVMSVITMVLIKMFDPDPPHQEVSSSPLASSAPAPAPAPARAPAAPLPRLRPDVLAEIARLSAQSADLFCAKTLPAYLKEKPEARSETKVLAMAEVIGRYQITLNDLPDLREKRVGIGMSECALLAAWGRPTKINTTQTATSVRKQYVYRGSNSYVYTRNGIITSMQY